MSKLWATKGSNWHKTTQAHPCRGLNLHTALISSESKSPWRVLGSDLVSCCVLVSMIACWKRPGSGFCSPVTEAKGYPVERNREQRDVTCPPGAARHLGLLEPNRGEKKTTLNVYFVCFYYVYFCGQIENITHLKWVRWYCEYPCTLSSSRPQPLLAVHHLWPLQPKER